MIVSVAIQKGGVGKSTTATALAKGLQLKGYKVLLVDLDAQANTSYTLGILGTQGIYDVLAHDAHIAHTVQDAHGYKAISASPHLAAIDPNINAISNALSPIIQDYDFIILDTPPALSLMTLSALAASDKVLIPTRADILSLQAIGQLMNTIEAVREHNPRLNLHGLLITMHNPRTILARDMADLLEETAKSYKTFVYKSTIRDAVAVKEAQALQADIYTYAPKANVTEDYRAFTDEFIKRLKKKGK